MRVGLGVDPRRGRGRPAEGLTCRSKVNKNKNNKNTQNKAKDRAAHDAMGAEAVKRIVRAVSEQNRQDSKQLARTLATTAAAAGKQMERTAGGADEGDFALGLVAPLQYGQGKAALPPTGEAGSFLPYSARIILPVTDADFDGTSRFNLFLCNNLRSHWGKTGTLPASLPASWAPNYMELASFRSNGSAEAVDPSAYGGPRNTTFSSAVAAFGAFQDGARYQTPWVRVHDILVDERTEPVTSSSNLTQTVIMACGSEDGVVPPGIPVAVMNGPLTWGTRFKITASFSNRITASGTNFWGVRFRGYDVNGASVVVGFEYQPQYTTDPTQLAFTVGYGSTAGSYFVGGNPAWSACSMVRVTDVALYSSNDTIQHLMEFGVGLCYIHDPGVSFAGQLPVSPKCYTNNRALYPYTPAGQAGVATVYWVPPTSGTVVGFYPVPQYDMYASQISGYAMVNAASFVQNTSNALNMSGTVIAVRAEEKRPLAGLSYDYLSERSVGQLKSAYSGRAAQGAYTVLLPSGEASFATRPMQTRNFLCDDHVMQLFSVATSAAQQFKLDITSNWALRTMNPAYTTVRLRNDREQFFRTLAALRAFPHTHENPLHLKAIANFAKDALKWGLTNGPAIAKAMS